ncbi:hypothetical protein [Dictyobacter halimunensis]|uniref:hypothetical protein n=1 Tax=Dictyobacter halimunensis TaxID=3026934 RepID=UPI0030C745A2
MTSFLETGAIVLTMADLIAILGACVFGAIALLHHFNHDRSNATFHHTELAKLCALLSCALSLAVMLCWGYYASSYLHDYLQSCHSLFNCSSPSQPIN